MNASGAAEQALRDGDPFAALKHLQDAVRASSADPKLRIFLFQLDRFLDSIRLELDRPELGHRDGISPLTYPPWI